MKACTSVNYDSDRGVLEATAVVPMDVSSGVLVEHELMG